MDRSKCQSAKFNKSPPFRATQLWNEAVKILQSGMPTRRHFYRMRYYDNCFTGKEAVEWLTITLTNNARFGKNVTHEGTKKLLQHFLKSGIFQSVKGSFTFKESGLYEFIDHNQDHNLMFSRLVFKEINQNIPSELNRRPVYEDRQRNHSGYSSPYIDKNPKSNFCEHQPSVEDISWKDFIVNRIQSLMPTLNVKLYVDLDSIQSDWVMHNVCPQFENLRKKTDLPFWVFTAITSVVKRQEESEYTTYDGFEKDVYLVVRDYLKHQSSPVIPFCLYQLIMTTFYHLHSLDFQLRNRSQDNNTVENLVLSMSHDWDSERLVHFNDLTKTILPPNTCFETAFTSDEPVTRIVPQSSVDTICLSSNNITRRPTKENGSSALTSPQTNIFESSEELPNFNTLPKKSPSSIIEKPHSNKYRNRKTTNYLRRTQSMAQIDQNLKVNTLPLSVSTSKSNKHHNYLPQQQSYINYGLSQSMDDLLVMDDNEGLDFEEAMKSVNRLMTVSCGSRPTHFCSSSDLNSSSLETLSTGCSCQGNKARHLPVDSCLWYEDVQETARLIFQSLLMLMPPMNRTSLSMLLQFIDQLHVPTNSSITKAQMVNDLTEHILYQGPRKQFFYGEEMALSVVYFLIDNGQYIFRDLPKEDLFLNEEENLKENSAVKDQMVFCEQVTKNQFENQGATSSWLALAELLDQIINDKKMKSKEKKKRLKKFKEAYPHIYKQRFHQPGKSNPNEMGLHRL